MAVFASDLTALVTGSSRGIGQFIARALAARGVRVAIQYRTDREAADETHATLEGEGHVTVQADLSEPNDVKRLWLESTALLGSVDIVINNAAAHGDHPVLSTDYVKWQQEWKRTLTTNLVGPANLCLLAAQAMAGSSSPYDPEFGRGRIVNISSRGAFRGEPFAPAYGASKAGLNSLSQSLALALAPQEIYVFCLAPGWVQTHIAEGHLAGPRGPDILAQHPLGRITTPEEVARAALFCALDAPAAMTGSIIDVNGASYLRT
jgi:NAD(P)-dependent dehydrogenase (short-subunit alcohol dehydrogenase family)